MSVSNCCGKTYEEEVNTCAECGSFEIGENGEEMRGGQYVMIVKQLNKDIQKYVFVKSVGTFVSLKMSLNIMKE